MAQELEPLAPVMWVLSMEFLTVVSIWEVSQWVEDLPSPSLCLEKKYKHTSSSIEMQLRYVSVHAKKFFRNTVFHEVLNTQMCLSAFGAHILHLCLDEAAGEADTVPSQMERAISHDIGAERIF